MSEKMLGRKILNNSNRLIEKRFVFLSGERKIFLFVRICVSNWIDLNCRGNRSCCHRELTKLLQLRIEKTFQSQLEGLAAIVKFNFGSDFILFTSNKQESVNYAMQK